ncbi:MAG: hypothetical protein GWN00_29495 [Aliifodinibius sp.]|nr:hypothetical protein [Fodinibius sp.]NIV14913.1 hypothetical protein [Fodinibius sp.]NIY28773.1 hypothetical protein [Fodinibius sp.]
MLLMIPLIAMQFSNEVVWTLSDFVIAGTLLFGTGLSYTLITRKSGQTIYRIAIGVALFTGLLLIWVNLAVGLIGSENNPVNLLYFGVIILGIIGSLIARFRSRGMQTTMFAMGLTQTMITVIALIGGFYQSPPSTVLHIIGINGFFITLFVLSALLFRYAAKGDKSAI